MMRRAIEEGVEIGIHKAFEKFVAENCDGSEVCVMGDSPGCACLYVKWKNLPWYKKIFHKEPLRPSTESLKSALLTIKIRKSLK